MKQEQFPISRQSKSWQTFERIGVIIALIASLATVIGLLLQVRSEKRTIEIQIISADQLTRLPSVSGLGGEFTYNNIPVTDLWRLRLQFVNIGDATLIGEGPASSLMAKMISISFPSDVRILDASSDAGSFYSLTQPTINSLGIEFTQWRPGERFETIVYLASNNVLVSPPIPTVSSRPIINGDVQITDLTAKNATQPHPAIDYISPPLALVGKILGGILALVIGLGSFGWLVVASPLSYFRAQYWKFKYSDSFQKHLESLKFPEKQKKELLKAPWASQYGFHTLISSDITSERDSRSAEGKVRKSKESSVTLLADGRINLGSHDRIWKSFDGPSAPQPSFDTFGGTVIGLLIGIGLTASCVAILASMIII